LNLEHLKAILWLRWRLTINQWRRAGTFNFVLMMILVCSTLAFAALSFFLAIGLGIFLLPKATPMAVMVVWDVMIGVLLFSWSISLLVEIQRMELLSLEKLLHLPMSLRDAFLLNYLSSLICLNIACFFPASIGLCIALSITHGPRMLILVPMVLSFILMLTAVTYQFRGWLASLMSDKRRQRTVIMVITFAISQVPKIVMQLTMPSSNQAEQRRVQEQVTKSQQLTESFNRQEISKGEYDQRLAEMTNDFKQRKKDAEQASQAMLDRYLTFANQILPVGWLAYSSRSLLAGSILFPALCLVGMTAIGSISLRRSYRSTINYYTGNLKTIPAKTYANAKRATKQEKPSFKPSFMERKIPRFSEHSTAIALCSFRNLLRAPEAKMLLIGPMILGIMFVVMIVSNRTPSIPAGFEPLVWLAGVGMLTFMCLIMMLNIFGMDRSGFRCFVLMPAERSEILFGKNISMLPIIGAIAVLVAVGLSYLAPIGLLTILANACQMLIAFLMSSIVGNWVSIQFPFAMIPGAGKPVQVNVVTMLVQMAVMFAGPAVIIPGALFFGIEWSLNYFMSIAYLPVFFVLSVIELWLVQKLYRYVLNRQGRLLQMRETRILEILTANSE
jgi:hypothetical protein